jgi:hypothetical protein
MNTFPNPFSNQLTIVAGSLNPAHPIYVKVSDVLGKLVLQTEYNGKSVLNDVLNTESLKKGVYFISVENNSNKSVTKVIKD